VTQLILALGILEALLQGEIILLYERRLMLGAAAHTYNPNYSGGNREAAGLIFYTGWGGEGCSTSGLALSGHLLFRACCLLFCLFEPRFTCFVLFFPKIGIALL
jgi:hypothetical protein